MDTRSFTPVVRIASRLLRGASLLSLSCLLTGAVFAQTQNTDNANRDRDRMRADRRADGSRNFSPEDMQNRLLNNLRDQLGVTDDAEWGIISDRLKAVADLRRQTGGLGGFGGFRGGPPGASTSGRTSRSGNPEQDALRQAVTDKLTDAEIKSRLDRLREVRKANEQKLAKAQEDLRAVLTIRQEAILVMYGLLP